MRSKFFTIAFIIFFGIKSYAQKLELGSWNILNLKYTVNEKWSVFGETQIRSLKFYNNFHYYELKGGMNYKIHKNATLSLGTGSYQTFNDSGNFKLPKNNNEFRVWPQIIFLQSLSKFNIEQRYRAEFRFTSKGYRNRFRYRVGVSYPFGKEQNNYKPYQLSASNELFFTDKEPYFERNRMLVAFHYKPSKSTTLQLGYLHQFDFKINDETGKNFLQLGCFIEIFRKQFLNTNHHIELKDN